MQDSFAMWNKMRTLSLITGLVLMSSGTVTAQQTSAPSAAGDWTLTAIYDVFQDGHLRSTWGDKPQGLLQLSAGGILSLQV